MNTHRYHIRAILLCGALAACSMASRAQEPPDAPPSHLPVPPTRPATPATLKNRQWSTIVEPGEKVPPMTARQKLLLPLHEELSWTTPISILYSGWYGILRDSDPHYGVNLEGWGERVGAAALRQATTRELTDSFLPILFREDPRYYRQAYGSFGSRAEYAATRIFIDRRDSGKSGFNFSDVLGRGMASALTQTYYPQSSVGTGVVLKSWGVSLAALGGTNLFSEFLPDIRRKLLHNSF